MTEHKIPGLWEPVPRRTNTPFGYILNPDNPNQAIPDPVLMPHLEDAIIALNQGGSLRDVADFINAKLAELGIDRTISHTGLKLIWNKHRTRPIGKPRPKPKPKSMAERKELRRRKKIADVKKSVTFKLKKIEKLGGEISEIKEEIKKAEPLRGVVEVTYIPEPEEEHEIIFKPNKGPQTEFLAATEQEVLYGGAAGGEPVSRFYRLLSS